MKLTKAGQSEILRASQRDEIFKEQFGNNISELLQLCGGIRLWIKYKDISKLAGRVLYQTMTTMLNLQTLGEEFTGMIQVNRTGTSLPTKYAQFLMILVGNCGTKIFITILQSCEKKLISLLENQSFQPSVIPKVINILKLLKKLIPIFEEIHKTLFYFNGNYYEFSKRIFGIRYALVRYWLKDNKSLPAFRLLGFIFLIYITVHLTIIILNLETENYDIEKKVAVTIKTEDDSVSSFHKKCPLCLNVRQNTSTTPCGHLFCWSCIILWLQEQPNCPICRQNVSASRVVYLQNYSIED